MAMGLEAQIEKILPEMGFEQRMAITSSVPSAAAGECGNELGQIAAPKPDLALDEPTNHLDLETIGGWKPILKGLITPIVIVSHDRSSSIASAQIVETRRGVPPPTWATTPLICFQKPRHFHLQLSATTSMKELEKQQVFC